MKKNLHLKLLRDEGGQALVEASIGIALMAFTWSLLVVLSIMTTNASRTAMAARHGAWIKGNDPSRSETVLQQRLANEFFFHSSFVSASFEDADGAQVNPSQYDSEIDADSSESVEETLESGNGPYKVSVQFGAINDGLKDGMPWVLLKIKVPFMPSTEDIDTLFVIDTSCQWEEVDETWTDAGEAILGIFSTLKSIITNAIGLA